MPDRTFGVEVECGHPLNSEGVRKLIAAEKSVGTWSVGCDGSGVEARSPILLGAEGEGKLRKVMDLLRETGGYTTRSDGMHVHFGGRDYIRADKEPIVRLMESWCNNVGVIHQFVHPWRRQSAMSTNYITKNVVELAKKDGRVSPGGGALNLTNIASCRAQFKQGGTFSEAQPTFEVRLHEGTLDPDEAIPWIRMMSTFLDKCFEGVTFDPHKDHTSFLEALGLDDESKAALARKAETSDKKVFGNRPYDPEGNTKKGHWWCGSESGQGRAGCKAWHKNGTKCPKGVERNEYNQDGYNGKRVSAGGL
jgi:hypothetical protein